MSVVVLSAALAFVAAPARATTIMVTATSDDTTVNGNCTLREAIIAANEDRAVDACTAGSGVDTLSLPAGTYTLSMAGTSENAAATGDLDVTEDLTIQGAGRLNTTINAAGIDRILDVMGSGVSLTVSDVRLTGGSAVTGGGIYVTFGSLHIVNSRIHGNTGTGVYATGSTVTIANSRIDNNAESGILTTLGGSVLVTDSDVSNNTRSGNNGGAGIATISGPVTLVNTTVSGNVAGGAGGGLFTNGGSFKLYNVTVSANTADSDGDNVGDGGGIYSSTPNAVTLRNSIISGNFDTSPGTQYPDCSGTLTSEGFNLITATTGCTISGNTIGNLTGVSANLGPLQLNGGDTRTHALLAGSPAVDGGDPGNWCVDQNGALLNTDQRGYGRVGLCDIGAYEYLSPGTPTPTPTSTTGPSATPSRTSTATATATSTATRTPTFVAQVPSATLTPTHTSAPCVPGPDQFCTSTPAATSVPCSTVCVYLPSIMEEP